MSSVERVKNICRARKIPLSKIEKDLGFANGYIGQLKKGTFPDNRLVAIASYLNVPEAYLLGREDETFYPDDVSRRICSDIQLVLQENPDALACLHPERDAEAQIRAGAYRFSSVNFPLFGQLLGKTISDYLPEPPSSAADHPTVTDDDIKFALFGGDAEITDAMYDEVKRFAEFVKHRGSDGSQAK